MGRNGRAVLGGFAALLPAAVAAVAGGALVLVAILMVLGVLAVLLRVAPDLLVAPDGSGPSLRRRSRFAIAARPRTDPPVRGPADLRRMETLVAARVQSAIGVHNWLRPLVADIASSRLRQHGSDLDQGGPHAIPDPLWALIRPDRPQPKDREGPGISLTELTLVVDQLEEL
jgi:hypothetical protein